MDSIIFSKFSKKASNLSDIQFLGIKKLIKELDYSKFLCTNLDESSNINACRHCNSTLYNKWGRRNGMQRYKCKECKKTFNSLSKTPLARLRKREKWIQYADCLIQGLSLRKAAEVCKIHKNTSFLWRHRFLTNSTNIKAKSLSGIVEMNSILMIKSYKGSKNMDRRARKRGLNRKQREESKEGFNVFFSKNRASYVYDKIFDQRCNNKQGFSLDNILLNDSLLCSNKESIYLNFRQEKKVQHSIVKIRKNTVKNNIVHIKNVDLYSYSLLKWMHRFKGVATKYLDNYISWYRFLDEFEMQIPAETVILRAKSGGKYKHLPLFSTQHLT